VLIHFWVQCVRILGIGFLFSYFWTTSSAIYYLLRYGVDATEMDEIVPEQEEEPSALPPIHADSAGAPVVEDGQKRKEAGDELDESLPVEA
jgi:hypothetical protein